MRPADILDRMVDFATLGEYGLEEPLRRNGPFDGQFCFNDPPAYAETRARALRRMEAMQRNDERFQVYSAIAVPASSLDVDLTRERRQRRRRRSDRA